MDSIEDKAEEAERTGDLEMALRLWKEAAANRHEPSLFCRYGRAAQALKRWGEAEGAFAEALRLDPANKLAMEAMGILWSARTDKDDRKSSEVAKDWFLKALAHERSARVLTLLGAAYLGVGDVASARRSFEDALRVDARYEEALYNLALLDVEKNPQKAIELLEKAIEIDPDYSAAHQELGKQYQQAGDLTKAEYHFRRSMTGGPPDYWSQLFLANLLAVEGRIDEAEQAYRLAISARPEIKGGTEIFARFLESIGKKAEAAALRRQIN
jgi:tetratricopeptide (TPR) repeat protein